MKVLGISPLDKDSTVSIVIDGVVVFAAGEERFSRVKQQDGFPKLALQAALEYTGLTIADFDAVAYPFLTAKSEAHVIEKNLAEEQAFIKEFKPAELGTLLDAALAKVPSRHSAIHGLKDPNETWKKASFTIHFIPLLERKN